ncbi:uncharacterized protein G2W53_039600 [Senna tora]|uniref:Uncharacterized protein n=1 Tax=Senna tora TaxID=362788 RepID=A0A834W828_9FABA|nr:uncharacterized protein G2W53_039600 [Senna tora]
MGRGRKRPSSKDSNLAELELWKLSVRCGSFIFFELLSLENKELGEEPKNEKCLDCRMSSRMFLDDAARSSFGLIIAYVRLSTFFR